MQTIEQNPKMAEYFLKSARLGFREWRDSDKNFAQGLWGDAEVTKLIGGPFSPEQVGTRLKREISTGASSKLQYWPIFLLTTNEHVGCCGLRPYKPEESVAEIGFHLCKAHWGKGYASEAAIAVMRYAFEELKLSALFAGHNPNNAASKVLLGKLGFRYVRDEFYQPTGLMHPSYLISCEEFATIRLHNQVIKNPSVG